MFGRIGMRMTKKFAAHHHPLSSHCRRLNRHDFDSEDIDGMDDDAGGEEEPLPTGHWTATSSYDIYMADTPKEGNGNKTAEDGPSKKQPKCRRQRRRSKSRQGKSADTGTGDNSTPESAEDGNNPLQQDLAGGWRSQPSRESGRWRGGG